MSFYNILTVLVICVGIVADAAEWSYSGEHGPDTWKDLTGSFCGEKKQSPINIVTMDTTGKDLGEFTFRGYKSSDEGAGTVTGILNNGHTLQVSLTGNYALSGGGLGANYRAAQFHFHWGDTSGKGSEHTVDGKSYDAEMHIVHYNSDKYDDLGAAAGANDSTSLAVLGVFLETGGQDNEAFSKVFDNAAEANENETSIETFSVAALLPANLKTFYRYQGSLTTPKCNEIVVWTVFTETVSISESQMAVLRDLYKMGGDSSSGIIGDNFRPVQEVNDREVYLSSAPKVMSSVSLVIAVAVYAMRLI